MVVLEFIFAIGLTIFAWANAIRLMEKYVIKKH